jgi:hypothetical protein
MKGIGSALTLGTPEVDWIIVIRINSIMLVFRKSNEDEYYASYKGKKGTAPVLFEPNRSSGRSRHRLHIPDRLRVLPDGAIR